LYAVIDRIYVTTEGSTQKCQIYTKGCATEDYTDIFGAADYIAENAAAIAAPAMPSSMCDLDYIV
jgi:site-specific DNA recombinase